VNLAGEDPEGAEVHAVPKEIPEIKDRQERL